MISNKHDNQEALQSSNVVDNDKLKKTLYNTLVSKAAGSQAKIPNRTGFIS